MHIFIDNMAPIMFGCLVVFLLLGYPVAFALAFNGLLFGVIGIWLGLFSPNFLQALPDRVYGVMTNETLLAIPFFTFMGLVLERSGMAEDLLETIGQLFGPVRGGLAFAVILVGALLAATTGVVAASVISMGLISLPIMLRYGYDRRFATGVIAASGTLAQIIPPSLVLIVMADQLGRSVGDMYEGALIPGLVLSGIYLLYAGGVAVLFPKAAPALPPEARSLREPGGASGVVSFLVLLLITIAITVVADRYLQAEMPQSASILAVSIAVLVAFVAALVNHVLKLGILSQLAERVVFVLIPPLALIFLVLGTIFLGVATPTEGGAMGASGALLLALLKRRLTFDLLSQAINSTAKLSSFVIFILLGARVLLPHLLWGRWPCLGRAPARRPAGRRHRLSPGRQPDSLRAGLLPRFLRAGLHHHPAARPRRRQAGHRPDLVRRHHGGQHADLVHASALRFCPLLSALGGTHGVLPGQDHRQTHGAGDDGPDLLGRRAVRLHPGDHGADRRPLPGDGDALQGHRHGREPGQHQEARHSHAAVHAAAPRSQPAQAQLASIGAEPGAKEGPRHVDSAEAHPFVAEGRRGGGQPCERALTIVMS